jgi:hypothetical protein
MMSAHVSAESFQYIGILDGVVYRIDPSSGAPLEPILGSQPFKMRSEPATGEASPQISLARPAVAAEPAIAAPTVVEAASVERVVPVSNLFPRSGGEPLRAGHPDLWALLVAGTCLEGSNFRSA